MRVIIYITVLLLMVACGTEGEPIGETTTVADGASTTSQGTTMSGFSTDMSLPDEFPSDLLEKIAADAAQRVSAPISEVEVASVDAMTFNDASLGCPEPGKMYAQVLTPGFIVLLDAGGEELDYRVVEGSGAFRICEQSG